MFNPPFLFQQGQDDVRGPQDWRGRMRSNPYNPRRVHSRPETKHRLTVFYGFSNNRKNCCELVGTMLNGETKAFVTHGPRRLVVESSVPECQFNDRFVAVPEL